MTIEERLERLVERHEGLGRSVELMLTAQREAQAEYETRFAANERRMAQLMDLHTRLGNIVTGTKTGWTPSTAATGNFRAAGTLKTDPSHLSFHL